MPLSPEIPAEIAACQLAFDLSSTPAGIMGLDGRPIWFSAAFPALLGYTPEEFARQTPADRIHPEDLPEFERRVAELKRGAPSLANVDRRYLHKQGHYVWISISASMLRNPRGEPTHVLGIFQDISDRKRHERETQETKNQLTLILESVQDVVWSFSVTEQRLSFLNQLATRALYLRDAREFYDDPELWMNVVHPDDRELVRRIRHCLPSGSTEDIYRILRPDGTERWVHSRSWTTLGPDGKAVRFEGVIRDVTEAHAGEQAVREREARLQLVITAGKLGIWEIDIATGQGYWSREMREIIGVGDETPASVANFEAMIHPDDRSSAQRHLEDVFQSRAEHFSAVRIVRAGGEVRWVEGFGRVVRKGPADPGKLFGAILDITDTKRSRRLIETQRVRLAATAKMSALGEMAGGLAHEIINPLAIIHGNALLLRQQSDHPGFSPARLREVAETIEHTSERISKIIKSLRAFARDVEQDPFQRVAVLSIIEETASLCRSRFRERNIELIQDAFDPALSIEARPVQITQVLLNLLNNSVDAVEQQSTPWIRISVTEAPESVKILVADSGPGIPPDLREKLFQPFFTTKEIGKGTGLGLSVSSGIVETHSGQLHLDPSHPNTCFIVSLPKRQS